MGLFSRKKKQQQQPGNTSMAAKGGRGFVAPPEGSDPSLPGLAGWCGSDKRGPVPMRFNYRRPDGKSEDPKRLWSDPDEY